MSISPQRLMDLNAAVLNMAVRAGVPQLGGNWPSTYINIETGREYKPHHNDEERFVFNDSPRYALAKGGEGGGKSVAGIVKTLNRLKRGMSGVMGSSDLQHFKKSLWPEFRRWCPPQVVIPSQRYRLKTSWEPQQMFTLTFITGAQLICGGFDDPSGWEGPNLTFAHWDEARRHKSPAMLKVLDGRCRITGPDGEPPQIWLTTTPAKHWLFDYFGPIKTDEVDEYESFKQDALVISLLTRDNEAAGNLSEGFTKQRGQSLTEAEKRVLLEAAWEDIDAAEKFLPSMTWWDGCKRDIASLDRKTPIVLAADAAISGDTFGLVGVGLAPEDGEVVAVRLVRAWEPKGSKLDFDEIEKEIRLICETYNVLQLAYDPYQLHQMMTRLGNDHVVDTVEFNQGGEREIADKQLLDLIINRRLIHDGNELLRRHVDNADKKVSQDRKLRIVKRSERLKIDLAVCTSMASKRILELPITNVTDNERQLFGGMNTWRGI